MRESEKQKMLETGKDDFRDVVKLLKIIKISEGVKERSHMFEDVKKADKQGCSFTFAKPTKRQPDMKTEQKGNRNVKRQKKWESCISPKY